MTFSFPVIIFFILQTIFSVIFLLAERDKNNDVLWTWAYPSITSEQREFLISKSCLGSDNPLPVSFLYGQWKETWYYISIINVGDGNTVLSQV